MAEISAQLVKELREKTGAGMMECKKALVEANGSIEDAITVLRKRGIASAGKKESRSTKQGMIAAHIAASGKLGVLVEVNCESDFVARTEDFQSLAADIAAHIADTKPKAVRVEDVTEAERSNFKQHEALYEQKFVKDQNTTVGELVKAKIAKLGENINVSRFVIYDVAGVGQAGYYVHTGNQIGVLLEMAAGKQESLATEDSKKLLHDIAMQIAAAHPQCVSRENVPAELLEKEREIQKERARNEGKPEKMLERVVEGRLTKFYEEICLLEQPFIRENTISIAELIKQVAGKVGDTLTVNRFVRFKVGDAGDAPGVQETPQVNT